MAEVRPIRSLTLDADRDGELFAALNAVAKHFGKKAHPIARTVLSQGLNKIVEELGIDIYEVNAQSTLAGHYF